MARKGDSTVYHTRSDTSIFFEDPTKLYIFRNFYAAEAQLGVSDYSPTGTAAGRGNEAIQAWSLLASTQASQVIPDYNKLVVSEQKVPTVLTKKQNGQCIAYQPISLDIIKMTTQYSRDIVKLNALPQGVNCD